MKDKFDKVFDNSYSYFREIQILTYLNQRDAPVPILRQGIANKKKIIMDNVGVNLFEQKKCLSFNQKLEIALAIMNAIQKIYNLGIFHYDVALRNLTFKESSTTCFTKIYVIDFSISTSSIFRLQKPLWILPNLEKQHKDLVDAISRDWDTFFNFYGKEYHRNSNKIIEVSMEDYENYWIKDLNVEKLKCPLSVIFHSVSFALEDLFSSNPAEDEKYNLKKLIRGLRNIKNDSIILKKIQMVSKSILDTKNKIVDNAHTPIPNISTEEIYKEKTLKEKIYHLLDKNQRYIHVIVLCGLFYAVDKSYSYHQIIINNSDYYMGLTSIFIWMGYLLALVIRKVNGLNIFEVCLYLQLIYFFLRILFETN